jgi:hypothetical protein
VVGEAGEAAAAMVEVSSNYNMAKASEFERHAVSRRIFLRREKNQFRDSSKKGR